MTLVDVTLVIVAVCYLALAGVSIYVVMKMRKTLTEFTLLLREIRETSQKATSLVESVHESFDRTSQLMKSVGDYMWEKKDWMIKAAAWGTGIKTASQILSKVIHERSNHHDA